MVNLKSHIKQSTIKSSYGMFAGLSMSEKEIDQIISQWDKEVELIVKSMKSSKKLL